jgi:hypothetical protein
VLPDSLADQSPAGPLEDIVVEAQRIMAAAQAGDVPARLIGGLAVRLHIPPGEQPLMTRVYKDIDLATPRGKGKAVAQLLTALGYDADRAFNTTNGHSRLLFFDPPHARQLDVFVGSFEMCHEIPLGDRITTTPMGIPLAELLMTKLQVVELNEKDLIDIKTILYHHELADDDDGHVNQAQVAAMCAADWGLWRTTKLNVERVREGALVAELSDDQQAVIIDRLDRLWQRIEAQPKSRKWKLRSRVGEKVRWYQEPEEVDQ